MRIQQAFFLSLGIHFIPGLWFYWQNSFSSPTFHSSSKVLSFQVKLQKVFPSSYKKELPSLPSSSYSSKEGEGNHTSSQNLEQEVLTLLREKIQEEIQYPFLAKKMGWEGESLFLVKISPEGNSIFLKKSSGYPLLDEEAEEALKKALSFLSVEKEITFEIPIRFSLLPQKE